MVNLPLVAQVEIQLLAFLEQHMLAPVAVAEQDVQGRRDRAFLEALREL